MEFVFSPPTPTETRNSAEVASLKLLKDGRKYLIGLVSHDDIKLTKALENLPVQHRGVRATEQYRQFRLLLLDQSSNIQRKNETATESGESHSIRMRSQYVADSALIQCCVVGEFARFDETLRIIDLDFMPVRFAHGGQCQQTEMRMNVEQRE